MKNKSVLRLRLYTTTANAKLILQHFKGVRHNAVY